MVHDQTGAKDNESICNRFDQCLCQKIFFNIIKFSLYFNKFTKIDELILRLGVCLCVLRK